MGREPTWTRKEHDVELVWVGPIDYADWLSGNISAEDLKSLGEFAGVYFWRAKTGWFERKNLYIGQTFQGVLRRTQQHLRGELGVCLDHLHRSGKPAYMWAASVQAQAGSSRGKFPLGFPEALFDSLERGFILHYQPFYNMRDRRLTTVPLTLNVINSGSIPADAGRVMRFERGDYVHTP